MIAYPYIVSRILKSKKECQSMIDYLSKKGIGCAIREAKNGFIVCRELSEEEASSKEVSKQIIKDAKNGLLSGKIVLERKQKKT
mgnify:CR=1 FL=1